MIFAHLPLWWGPLSFCIHQNRNKFYHSSFVCCGIKVEYFCGDNKTFGFNLYLRFTSCIVFAARRAKKLGSLTSVGCVMLTNSFGVSLAILTRLFVKSDYINVFIIHENSENKTWFITVRIHGTIYVRVRFDVDVVLGHWIHGPAFVFYVQCICYIERSRSIRVKICVKSLLIRTSRTTLIHYFGDVESKKCVAIIFFDLNIWPPPSKSNGVGRIAVPHIL